MRELSHNKHRYEGDPGEKVTITFTPHDTTQLVNFVLDGAPGQPVPAGTPITFNFKEESGAVSELQIEMEFNGEGSYDIKVSDVENCPEDPTHTSCTHTRNGPPRVIENHKYIVK